MTIKTKEPDPVPKPGMTLPNGAEVIRYRADKRFLHIPGDTGIVLAKWDKGQRTEYITWIYSFDIDGIKINTCCGHYYDALKEAIDDFENRN